MGNRLHEIHLKDTSPSELARFRQFVHDVHAIQKSEREAQKDFNKVAQQKQIQPAVSSHTFIKVMEVVEAIKQLKGQKYEKKVFSTLMGKSGQPDNKQVIGFTDSENNKQESVLYLDWKPFYGINLLPESWKTSVDIGKIDTEFSLKIFDYNNENIAFEFYTNEYDLFVYLFNSLGIKLSEKVKEKYKQLYLAKIKGANNDPEKLDVIYANFPDFLKNAVSDELLYKHLILILDSIDVMDYFDKVWGGTNEDMAVLKILYAIKDRKFLYEKLNGDPALLHKIYSNLKGKEIDELLQFLTRLVEENDTSKPTHTVYFENSYYLFRNVYLKTTKWNGEKTFNVNNYRNKKVKDAIVGDTGTAAIDIEPAEYKIEQYVPNKPFTPLTKLNFGSKLGKDGEQVSDDKTFVIALKLHNMATRQANWDIFNVATDLLSLLSGAGALRVVATKAAPMALRVLAGAVLAKDATHYYMLSQNTLEKWHKEGYGWLAKLWMAFSVTTDILSLGLPNAAKMARYGDDAANLADTTADAEKIRKAAQEANELVLKETGKDVRNMSKAEFDKFVYSNKRLVDTKKMVESTVEGKYNKEVITNKYPKEKLPQKGYIDKHTIDSNGLVRRVDGHLMKNGEYNFVITKENKLILGEKHHLLGNAKNVKAAGSLRINKGRIVEIDNMSGHYKPTIKESLRYPKIFKEADIKIRRALLKLYEFEENAQGYIATKGNGKPFKSIEIKTLNK